MDITKILDNPEVAQLSEDKKQGFVNKFNALSSTDKHKFLLKNSSDYTKLSNTGEKGKWEFIKKYEDNIKQAEPSTIKQVVAGTARPVLEYGGLAAGELAGGAIGGLAGAVGAIPGAMAGGGFGYATGKRVADYTLPRLGLESEKTEPSDITMNILSGAGMSGVGRIGGKVVEYGMSKIPGIAEKFKTGIKDVGDVSVSTVKSVGKTLKKWIEPSETETFKPLLKEAKEVEEKIGEAPFTLGQETGIPGAISKERGLVSKHEGAANLYVKKLSDANITLDKYYDKNFPSEEGTMTDLLSNIEQKASEVEKGVTTAKESLEGKGIALQKGVESEDKIEQGKKLYTALNMELKNAKGKVDAAYSKDFDSLILPEEESETLLNNLIGQKIAYLNEQSGYLVRDTTNSEAFQKLFNDIYDKGTGELKPIGLLKLKDHRYNFYREFFNEKGKPGNFQNERLLGELKTTIKSIQEAMNAAKRVNPEKAAQFDAAEATFKKEMLPFRNKQIRAAFHAGSQFENRLADIPKRFFKSENEAASFNATLGKNIDAKQAMTDFASQDLLNYAKNPSTGEMMPEKILRWKNENDVMLKKLGITNFDDMQSSSKTLLDAIGRKGEFDKSLAAKLLKRNPDKALGFALKETNMRKAMIKLMNEVESDKRALSGLKKAMGDYFISSTRITKSDIENNLLGSLAKSEKFLKNYKPALDVLYKDDPAKLEALKIITRAHRIIERIQSPILRGSSGTASELANQDIAMQAIQHVPKIGRYIRFMNTLKQHVTSTERNAMMIEASFNPDFAYQLINLSKQEYTPSTARITAEWLIKSSLVISLLPGQQNENISGKQK